MVPTLPVAQDWNFGVILPSLSLLTLHIPRVTKVWMSQSYVHLLTTRTANTLIWTNVNSFLDCANGLLNSIPASSLSGCSITDIAINWKLEIN